MGRWERTTNNGATGAMVTYGLESVEAFDYTPFRTGSSRRFARGPAQQKLYSGSLDCLSF